MLFYIDFGTGHLIQWVILRSSHGVGILFGDFLALVFIIVQPQRELRWEFIIGFKELGRVHVGVFKENHNLCFCE